MSIQIRLSAHLFCRYFMLLALLVPMVSRTLGPQALNPSPFDPSKGPDFSEKQEKKQKHRTALSDIPYETLKTEKDKLVAQGKKNDATRYLERMIATCPNPEESHRLLLELADIYFELGEFIKAEKTYQEFALLYPGHEKLEYVLYRAILCGFQCTLDLERDQSKTQEILTSALDFLKKSAFTVYRTEVQKLAHDLRQRLLESDIDRFNFYLNRGSFKAAHRRLDSIIADYKPQFSSTDIEPQFLQLQYRLALAENNTPQLLQTQWDLIQQFPDHAITKQLGTDATTIRIAFLANNIAIPGEQLTPASVPEAGQKQIVAINTEPKKFIDRF